MTKIFLVGGAVRDGLLGLDSKDKDFAVEAESFASMEAHIKSMGGEIFLSKPEFLTIRADVPNLGVADFVLCRRDGIYSDGRRPETVTPGTIFDDLARRDFTVNAIARDMSTMALIDPHRGKRDLEMRVLRCVGNAIVRFNEDKLRILRAMRFAITKGLVIDGDTTHAIRQFTHEDFTGVSTERLREELFKMFAEDSLLAFRMLFRDFPSVGGLILSRGIWFEPTTRRKH